MTFGQSYLTHLKCLENVGMTSIEPILFEERKSYRYQFLKAVLPDVPSLSGTAPRKNQHWLYFPLGKKRRKKPTILISTNYKGNWAVAYTTGVPAMIGAMMVMTGKWNKWSVHNIEELIGPIYGCF